MGMLITVDGNNNYLRAPAAKNIDMNYIHI